MKIRKVTLNDAKGACDTSPEILILCTGNSCRSQMAHGFLQSFDPKLWAYSAGTKASHELYTTKIKGNE